MVKNLRIKQIFFSLFTIAVFILAPYGAIAEPAPAPTAPPEEPTTCTWTNEYALTGEKDDAGNPRTESREATVERRVISGKDSDRLESCSDAIKRAEEFAKRQVFNTANQVFRGTRIGNSENCQYLPPPTSDNRNPKPIPLTLQKITKSNGEKIDEPCSRAQDRADVAFARKLMEKVDSGHYNTSDTLDTTGPKFKAICP